MIHKEQKIKSVHLEHFIHVKKTPKQIKTEKHLKKVKTSPSYTAHTQMHIHTHGKLSEIFAIVKITSGFSASQIKANQYYQSGS